MPSEAWLDVRRILAEAERSGDDRDDPLDELPAEGQDLEAAAAGEQGGVGDGVADADEGQGGGSFRPKDSAVRSPAGTTSATTPCAITNRPAPASPVPSRSRRRSA